MPVYAELLLEGPPNTSYTMGGVGIPISHLDLPLLSQSISNPESPWWGWGGVLGPQGNERFPGQSWLGLQVVGPAHSSRMC